MSIESRSNQYGTLFGNWTIQKPLGGNEGKTMVFQVHRVNLGLEETRAVKVINLIEETGKYSDLEAQAKKDYDEAVKKSIESARVEIENMIRLRDSPNVVTCFDYGVRKWEEQKIYNCFGEDLIILMELLKPLEQIEKDMTVYDEEMIYRIGEDICHALEISHQRGIIHRDIKPGNLFRSSAGNYKLGDFGTSRILSLQQNASTSTGTLAYAAPEQCAICPGDHLAYDARVDIYSLGLTLYELCNEHRLPFACSKYDSSGIIRRLKGETLPPPCQASPELANVILKACAYKADDRYQTAKEFCAALEEAKRNAFPRQRSTTQEINTTQRKSFNAINVSEVISGNFDPYGTAPAIPSVLSAKPAGTIKFAGQTFSTDIKKLTISLRDLSNKDLSVLKKCIHLKKLSLCQCYIKDISALGSLTSLTVLELEGNHISDISALGSLTSLTELGLSSNQISDISALGSLTSLILLGLSSNQISDISALGSLTNLTELGVSSNQISDISILGHLTSLILLDLPKQISYIQMFTLRRQLPKCKIRRKAARKGRRL